MLATVGKDVLLCWILWVCGGVRVFAATLLLKLSCMSRRSIVKRQQFNDVVEVGSMCWSCRWENTCKSSRPFFLSKCKLLVNRALSTLQSGTEPDRN